MSWTRQQEKMSWRLMNSAQGIVCRVMYLIRRHACAEQKNARVPIRWLLIKNQRDSILLIGSLGHNEPILSRCSIQKCPVPEFQKFGGTLHCPVALHRVPIFHLTEKKFM